MVVVVVAQQLFFSHQMSSAIEVEEISRCIWVVLNQQL